MKTRNRQIDIAKGLGILLVVFGHNQLISRELGNIIFSFHMPLFFFISGLFFNPDRSLLATISTRFDSLLKPYLVTLTLLGVLLALFRDIDFINYIKGVIYGNGSTIYWEQMWFLPHLFAVTLFSWFVLSVLKKVQLLPKNLYFIAFILLSIGVYNKDIFWLQEISFMGREYILPGLPLSVDLLLLTSFYFIFGYVFRSNAENFKPSLVIFLASLALFLASHYFFNKTLDFNMRRYDGIIIPTIEALSGIYITISISYLMQFRPVIAAAFSYIGSASLFILMFNGFIQGNAYALLAKFLGNDSFLVNAGAFAAASLIPVIAWSVVKKIDFLGLFFFPLATNSLVRQRSFSLRKGQ